MTETVVYLLRHAQSAPSPDLPEPRWPLSDIGSEQAENLVAQLTELRIDRVFSSPYRRAIDTVKPYSESVNIGISVVDDLRERKLKDRNMVDDWQRLIERAWRDFSFALPGCESGFSCQERMVNCISQLATANSGKRLLVSSHGNAIGLYLNWLDPAFGYSDWQAMSNPALYEILFVAGRAQWRQEDASHLANR